MQSVSSRIWTRVAVFISYDDNHYTTGTMTHTQNTFPNRIALRSGKKKLARPAEVEALTAVFEKSVTELK